MILCYLLFSILANNLFAAPSEYPIDEVTDEKPAKHLYIHLIPHTHDDVGWKISVDQYFSGTGRMDVSLTGVDLILDNTIRELIKDPKKRFSYVEMKFFTMWWKNQNDEVKTQVRQLVKEGRLEFLNGGWSMHDEACSHYEDQINNMLYGHQFLMKEF